MYNTKAIKTIHPITICPRPIKSVKNMPTALLNVDLGFGYYEAMLESSDSLSVWKLEHLNILMVLK